MRVSWRVVLLTLVPSHAAMPIQDRLAEFRIAVASMQIAMLENRHAVHVTDQVKRRFDEAAKKGNHGKKRKAVVEPGTMAISIDVDKEVPIIKSASGSGANVSRVEAGLHVGQRVLCREPEVDEKWSAGVVSATETSRESAMCQPDGWTSGYSFAAIKAMPAASELLAVGSKVEYMQALQPEGDPGVWEKCKIEDIGGDKPEDGAGTVEKYMDALKACTATFQTEAGKTMEANKASETANKQYVKSMTDAMEHLNKLLDTKPLITAYAADHDRAREFLQQQADGLTDQIKLIHPGSAAGAPAS